MARTACWRGALWAGLGKHCDDSTELVTEPRPQGSGFLTFATETSWRTPNQVCGPPPEDGAGGFELWAADPRSQALQFGQRPGGDAAATAGNQRAQAVGEIGDIARRPAGLDPVE